MRRNCYAGFTLLEILVVLILIGLFSLISIPAFFNKIKSSKLKATGEGIAQSLKLAKSYAITKREICRVDFDLINGAWGIYNGELRDKWLKLPNNIRIKEVTEGFDPAIFRADGTIKQAGHLVLENIRDLSTKKVIVNSLGRVRIE
ncbi:MAG: GspH/FimT family protein [Candidatus Omnitrophica bacterium]|nr:GspH/FimT family protein [Candidatus Omnitrophota bacterium]